MNCETQIRQLIHEKLDTIEREEQVKILYAVESGSRSWGFASPDSDYDVRFIYMRPLEYYLALEDKKDYIDWELNEVLDINGWDLVKVLRLFHKSNSTVFEWANSPVVYRTTKRWEQIYETAAQYFSKKACMYHYYGTAKSNYSKFFTEEQVKYKKYFYVIRPLLSCRWIEAKGTMFKFCDNNEYRTDHQHWTDVLAVQYTGFIVFANFGGKRVEFWRYG